MISSPNNQEILYINKLKQKKYRMQERKYLVEGMHLIEEAKKYGVLEKVYTTREDIEGTLVSQEVMKKISQTDTPSYVLGLCKMQEERKVIGKILILDDVSDPTNLGTLLRSAKAFGFNNVVVSNESVDFYNDKVCRGSQGAIFKLNLIRTDLKSFILDLKEKGYHVFGTNVRKGISVKGINHDNNIALVLGNETRGLKEEIAQICDQNIYIPLDDMESLNLSVAGSILMYELN